MRLKERRVLQHALASHDDRAGLPDIPGELDVDRLVAGCAWKGGFEHIQQMHLLTVCGVDHSEILKHSAAIPGLGRGDIAIAEYRHPDDDDATGLVAVPQVVAKADRGARAIVHVNGHLSVVVAADVETILTGAVDAVVAKPEVGAVEAAETAVGFVVVEIALTAVAEHVVAVAPAGQALVIAVAQGATGARYLHLRRSVGSAVVEAGPAVAGVAVQVLLAPVGAGAVEVAVAVPIPGVASVLAGAQAADRRGIWREVIADVPTTAAVAQIAGRRRLAAVAADVLVGAAVVVARIAGRHRALASGAVSLPVRRAASVVAGAAMRLGVAQVGLAAERRGAVTIAGAATTHLAGAGAAVAGCMREVIGAVVAHTAPAAILRVAVQVDLAAVGHVAVAVREARVAGELTTATDAAGRVHVVGSRVVAVYAAPAAVQRIGAGVGLAAIRAHRVQIAIAVTPTSVAGVLARPNVAGRGGVDRVVVAGNAALTAIVDVRVRRSLAAIAADVFVRAAIIEANVARHAARSADAARRTVRRVASVVARATVRFRFVDVGLASGVGGAIAPARVAGPHRAGAGVALPSSVREVVGAVVAAGATIHGITHRVRLAAVATDVFVGGAVIPADVAVLHAALAAAASRRALGEAAAQAATAAVANVCTGGRLTAVATDVFVGRAVVVAGAAHDTACARGAGGRAVGVAAGATAGTTVVFVGVEIDLAAVGLDTVAVGEAGGAAVLASSERAARIVHVRWRVSRTIIVACSAVGVVNCELGLAAVSDQAVAVVETRVAGMSAHARGAGCRGVGPVVQADGIAITAAVDVRLGVGLAAVAGDVLIRAAVGEPGVAAGHAADAEAAVRSTVVGAAGVVAGAAVHLLVVEVGLAAVGRPVRAVAPARVAGAHAAGAGAAAAGRVRVGVGAVIATAAAVVVVGHGVGLATVADHVLVVAAGVSGVATDAAGAANAAGSAVRGVAGCVASAAVAQVRRDLGLAAIAADVLVGRAIVVAGAANDAAHACGTGGRTMGIAASIVAVAAVGLVDVDVDLTPVVRVAVAVSVPVSAGVLARA